MITSIAKYPEAMLTPKRAIIATTSESRVKIAK